MNQNRISWTKKELGKKKEKQNKKEWYFSLGAEEKDEEFMFIYNLRNNSLWISPVELQVFPGPVQKMEKSVHYFVLTHTLWKDKEKYNAKTNTT